MNPTPKMSNRPVHSTRSYDIRPDNRQLNMINRKNGGERPVGGIIGEWRAVIGTRPLPLVNPINEYNTCPYNSGCRRRKRRNKQIAQISTVSNHFIGHKTQHYINDRAKYAFGRDIELRGVERRQYYREGIKEHRQAKWKARSVLGIVSEKPISFP